MATSIPDDPDAMLRRKQVAAALTQLGFPTAETTLATKAVRGGGPPYRLFGRIPSTAGATRSPGRRES